jgi:Domain of unknown function (DUF6134)
VDELCVGAVVIKSCALSLLCLTMFALPTGSFASPSAAVSAPQSHTYTYSVEHALYGNIGTFSDTVEQTGDTKRIDSRLRVAVRILGIVVHREDADRTEIWQDNRLISFHSVTTVNGSPIEVRGEARPDGFAITSPSGTTVTPGNIYPSSPWVAHLSDGPALMMSTKTGKLLPVTSLGGEQTRIAVNGAEVPVHHYEFITDKRQDVWMDAQGVPVRFRTEQSGRPIDFVLASETVVASSGRQ